MFTNQTTFLLGAGASWHYGYPTGEELVDQVISGAKLLHDHCQKRMRSPYMLLHTPNYVAQYRDEQRGMQGATDAWAKVRDECATLISRLEAVRPVVIDYFLGWNEDLRAIGRLMIAAAILNCEAENVRTDENRNRRLQLDNQPIKLPHEQRRLVDFSKYNDRWYRFITHRLAANCNASADLLKNNVHFVTFNYDCSLEFHLERALRAINLFSEHDIVEFLADNRIIHVYGQVRPPGAPLGTYGRLELNNLSDMRSEKLEDIKQTLDECFDSSANLLTIDPHDKASGYHLPIAKKWLSEADVVYILGYGFDDSNSDRIGLNELRFSSGKKKAVMFTNFEDHNSINRRVAHVLQMRHDAFVDNSLIGDPLNGDYAEKSVRDVYSALSMDFDALETRLLAATKV